MSLKAVRRCSLDLIVDILLAAKDGIGISALAQKIGNVMTVNRYLPLLLECELIMVKTREEPFLSKDGRKFGMIYITTEKGLNLVMRYSDLVSLLSEDDPRVELPMFLWTKSKLGGGERVG